MNVEENFYIVQQEHGSFKKDLPLWTPKNTNCFDLRTDDSSATNITKVDVKKVPGAFQLLNVFDHQEVERIQSIADQLGYSEDAAVSLPRSVRHNENITFVTDEITTNLIWHRVKILFEEDEDNFSGAKPLGINGRFRFYKYSKGDFFGFHRDGAWPGSRVINGEYHQDSYGDRYSLFTFLIFLSDDFTGGKTEFLVNRELRDQEKVQVSTPKGGVLCFPHGTHPLHCIHGSEIIEDGVKSIIRTDVLFSLE